MKGMHCNKSAERSAEKRQYKQCKLTDTEFSVYRLFLVDSKYDKCYYIDYDQPYVKIFHCGVPLFFNNTTAETANSRISDIPIKQLKSSISINPSALFVSPISKKLCRIIIISNMITAKLKTNESKFNRKKSEIDLKLFSLRSRIKNTAANRIAAKAESPNTNPTDMFLANDER